ncbi:hypothetical protein ACFFSY_16535 [Paenibacillus aurantiacus]|uniref:Uncharacterized protein n=1 Tax=Paenibacillus aurantiacus TaxID=1936118 RepID=A0ABV5KQP3_9BACL
MRTMIAIQHQLQQEFNRIEKDPRLPAARPAIRSYPQRAPRALARLHARRCQPARRRKQWPFELPGSRRSSLPA